MKIREIALHNYRSIKDGKFYVADYGLLIGGNNCGKTSVLDALRNFYEKDIKFDQQRDFPKFPTNDKESWVEIEYEMTKDEADSIKTEYRQAGNRFRVRKVLHSDDKTNRSSTGICARSVLKTVGKFWFRRTHRSSSAMRLKISPV